MIELTKNKTETHIYNAHYNNDNNDIHHRNTFRPHIIMMTIMTIIAETHIQNAKHNDNNANNHRNTFKTDTL